MYIQRKCFLFSLIMLCLSALVAGAASISYGPLAWPQDPPDGGIPTSVKVVWRTGSSSSGNYAYVGHSPTGPWTFTAVSPTTGTRHEALITGLSGDSNYYMYVTSGGTASQVVEFRTGRNLLVNGSFETWHPVSGEGWGSEEPDGWHGWEIHPWTPPGYGNPDHITISMNRATGTPTPLVKDGQNRVGMDEGWRSCYGGIYQEVTDLSPGMYTVSGWVAWLFDNTYTNKHIVEILARDGNHTPGITPQGNVVFSQDATASDLEWRYVQQSVECTTGTLTVYANLRSDYYDGRSFAHFDGFRVMASTPPAISFSNFQYVRTINGNAYDITITFDTDVPATTSLDWGETTSYGSTASPTTEPGTHHQFQLTGVEPRSNSYHYRVLAVTGEGVEVFSSDQAFAAPQLVISGINTAVDTETGIVCVISWHTNHATSSNKVYYRQLGSGSEYSAVQDSMDPAPAVDHSVALTGLSLNTSYEYYVSSGSDDIFTAVSSPTGTFQTPLQPGLDTIYVGMAMIGGSVPDGGDDVGPAREVSRMIQLDHPMVNISGLRGYSWPQCQPNDPGSGPNVYDWSVGDAANEERIVGKARSVYFQVWGNTPSWLTIDTPRYWEKFEQFVEAMTVHMNQNYGDIDFTFENEPNSARIPEGFQGNWADWYMHCLRHFYVAVHRADAQTGRTNRVIVGNLAGHSAGGFNDLYARGLKDYSDVLGYHAYPEDIRTGLKVEDLATIHGIQVNYGDPDKKIYVSEGWGSGRAAGFERSSPKIEPCSQEIENMWLAMTKGWDNVMTPRQNWQASYLYGMKFFCGNDNWGASNWRRRANPVKDGGGNITAFIVDGYYMDPDIAPRFWNGGMMDWYGNSKDCLIHVFPGNGLVFMNPGFELVSLPPNTHLTHFWTPTTSPASTDNYATDDRIVRSGSQSLKLTRTTAGNHGMQQSTVRRSVTPGYQYRARVWCKTEDVSQVRGGFYMRFRSIDDSQISGYYRADDLTGTGDWRCMEVIATAPSYASKVEVGCLIGGIGTAWFDDVTIASVFQQDIGVIRGYTLDEGQIPVPNCIVRTTTGGYQTVSDESGYYEMSGVEAGTYDVVCRKDGYVPHRVKNQTVAPGKLTFVSFNMGIPKPGLEVTGISSDRPVVGTQGDSANVTVNVANSKPYPVMVSDVGVFVENNGGDATGDFSIFASPENPRVVPANSNAQFVFALRSLIPSDGRTFSINAYAFGQEDRPNLLTNGSFDFANGFDHWSFWNSASTSQPSLDTTTFNSGPNSFKWHLSDTKSDKFNWATNWTAYGPTAPAAKPGTNYIVGAHHKDITSGWVDLNLFISEFYYDGTNWLSNGRRFSAVPQRGYWSHDVMIYKTGSSAVNPGLYNTNRLTVSVGAWLRSTNCTTTSWWDDVYLKEEGDWLADDRATSGAPLQVAASTATLGEAFSQAPGTWVEVSDLVITAGSESFASRLYAQQEDRSSGAQIVRASGVTPGKGDRVTVVGRVGNVDGERALVDAVLTVQDSPGEPEALGAGGQSIRPQYLSTIGLLMTLWGRVTHVAEDGSYFTLNDGSGDSGIKVICADAVEQIQPPAVGAFIQVTGISGCENGGQVPVIRLRSQSSVR